MSKCSICRNPDRRRAIELMWNGKMSCPAISFVLGGEPSQAIILKHLKEHAEGAGSVRAVDVRPETPLRERVTNLQRMQLDEIERRIEMAHTRAKEVNEHRAKERELHEAAGTEYEQPDADWSEFVDILGKDMQAAIGSIQKAQGLHDKREKATADLKLGLFEAMANAGLAPKALSGGVPALPTGEETDDDELDR